MELKYDKEDLECAFWQGWLNYEQWDQYKNKYIPATDNKDLETMIDRLCDESIERIDIALLTKRKRETKT